MQLKKKFSDESFGTANPVVIMNKPNMVDASTESASVIKVINFTISFLHKTSFDDL